MDSDFTEAGREIDKIPVRISYRIIELFSDGLYTSPNKAIEELVSNAYDAGADNVHVLLSPDRSAKEAVIIVADDGEGMDETGLAIHWLIGFSNKRMLKEPPRGRRQIGKFGIGKLATFVLAEKLTHVSKKDGRFFATTMDFTKIPKEDFKLDAKSSNDKSGEHDNESISSTASAESEKTQDPEGEKLDSKQKEGVHLLSLRELTEREAKSIMPSF